MAVQWKGDLTKAGNVEDANKRLWRRERQSLVDASHNVVKQFRVDSLGESITSILSFSGLQLHSIRITFTQTVCCNMSLVSWEA